VAEAGLPIWITELSIKSANKTQMAATLKVGELNIKSFIKLKIAVFVMWQKAAMHSFLIH